MADASAMPYVTNGNIYAPVMMLAEKASDLILGNTPLPAEHVEFYRHRKATAPGVAAPREAADDRAADERTASLG